MEVFYAIQPSPGKGLGVFATKPIKYGTRILCEKPLIAIRDTCYTQDNVEKAYRNLDLDAQRAFLNLASAHTIDPAAWPAGYFPEPLCAVAATSRSVYSIYQTNCVDISTDHGIGSAVFEVMSRINHSCLPNCFFSWNKKLQKETVHAIRDIGEGEELFVAYCNLIKAKDERADKLRAYGFDCGCQACLDEDSEDEDGNPQETSDDRRYRLEQLADDLDYYRRLPEVAVHAKQMNPITHAQEQIQLLEKEGIADLNLSSAYRSLAKLYVQSGKYKAALEPARTALRMSMNVLGPDHDSIGGAVTLLKDVKNIVEAEEGVNQALGG
ncbi:MAG: hypothetical protein M1820_009326 [Bogoriella megaspora]|nr:MAG: hypothetical protein M1820_009326 [Bogoriella megaspora]